MQEQQNHNNIQIQQNNNNKNEQTNIINNLGCISTLQFPPYQFTISYYKNPIILNQQYNKDIIPGQYQGGFQLWQCQIEFLKKIFEFSQIYKKQFQNQKVIQIGCGHGLLGIAAAILGAEEIILQDYNQNVIKQLTIPTISLNKIKSKVSYLWGDWDNITHNYEQHKYNVILGSQLTYKQQNYQKIINFIINNLKKNGVCYLANKNYYFGVGGNLIEFKEKVLQKGLYWKTITKIVPKSGGNKKQIIQIRFTQFQQS